jgi:hypothetical protein
MLEVVQFRAELYGEQISKLLALHGGGNREMPLTRGDCVSEPSRSALARQKPKMVFPESRTPEAAIARRMQLSEWQLLFDYCARGLNR